MSDLGETFKAFREAGQEKRQSNLERSVALLDAQKVPYTRLSEHHLRIGDYDFWPSTGLWISRTHKRSKGRGVLNLLVTLDRQKVRPLEDVRGI
jgi:hypothetical protein